MGQVPAVLSLSRRVSRRQNNNKNRKSTLLYFIILFVSVLVVLGFLRWKLGYFCLSKKAIERVHCRVRDLITVGHFDQAVKDLCSVLKRDRTSTSFLLYAEIMSGLGDHSKALELLEEAEKKEPHELRISYEKGRVYLAMEELDLAIECFERAKESLRKDEEVLEYCTALYLSGYLSEAWDLIEGRVLESSNGRLLALAGDCQFYWGNYRLATGFYQQSQHYGWMNQRTLSRTGHSLSSTGNFLEAERYFREVLKYSPSDVFATLGLGMCFEQQGLYKRALAIYQGGEAWELGDPHILRQAGICAVHTGKPDYASLYLSEAIRKGERSPQTFAFLGHSLESQRKWAEAEAVYFQLLEFFPDHVAGYRALSWLYGVGLSSTVSQSEGLALARKAVSLLPDATSWELLSACEARSGNFGRAQHIQEHLCAHATDKGTRLRLREALRTLRKGQPLDEQQVCRALVA